MKILRAIGPLALLLFLPGCLFGARIGGVGMGIGIGAEGFLEAESAGPRGWRVDEHVVDVRVNDDLTQDHTIETRRTLLTAHGVKAGQQTSLSFQPSRQSLSVEEAYVLLPGGERVDVTKDQIFTRPSEAARNSPGFVGSLTTTIVFPQLRIGSQTYVRWRVTDRSQPALGFNFLYRPDFGIDTDLTRITVSYPDALDLQWGEHGGFDVAMRDDEQGRVLTARLASYKAQMPEQAMVSTKDLVPTLVISSLTSWEEIGALFNEAVEARIEVTPEIESLAAEIVGERTGEDAARALYRWVCSNIHYVAVHIGAADAWVPHPAESVLSNGYGDCKDKYVLLAALLRSRGIHSEAVLVSWDDSFSRLPLWSPMQFDHCMLYLPEFDLYANPTDPYADLGQLEVKLSDKFVVHATPEGRVARTPRGSALQNTYAVHHDVRVTAAGEIVGVCRMDFGGRLEARFRANLVDAAPGSLADDILMGTPEGGDGALVSSEAADLDVPLTCTADWRSEQALEMGETVYLSTPVGVDFANPQRARRFLSGGHRQFPLVINSIELVWSHDIQLPVRYEVKSVPTGRRVDNVAGSFSSTYSVEADGRLLVTRRLRIAKDVFEASEYEALSALMFAVVNDFRSMTVLERGPDA